MQLMTGARHLEVQVVGDEHGNAVALNGRDCSTQRRFQKIFEEAPPTKPSEVSRGRTSSRTWSSRRNNSCRTSATWAPVPSVLVQCGERRLLFLELNPRLQVEHPCTEGVTGVNLPATQLQVAMGIPLPNMPEVRRLYGIDESDTTTNLDLDDPNTKYRAVIGVLRRAHEPRDQRPFKFIAPRRWRRGATFVRAR